MKPTMAVYDTIQSLDCEVETLNLGLATGMGAFLCAAGTKGLRYALPNARFLLQKTGLDDPFQGQASDIGLKVADNVADNQRMAKALAQMTGNTYEKVSQDLERDFYLSAFEAREYGLVDKVSCRPRPRSRPHTLVLRSLFFSLRSCRPSNHASPFVVPRCTDRHSLFPPPTSHLASFAHGSWQVLLPRQKAESEVYADAWTGKKAAGDQGVGFGSFGSGQATYQGQTAGGGYGGKPTISDDAPPTASP